MPTPIHRAEVPDDQTPEHVNDERDMLIVVVSGSGTIEIDGHPDY
jgi:hypothetical protein